MANRVALLETNKGNIRIELFEDKAPITSQNFVSLVEDKFYDGLTFHRYEPNFVIQGGCPIGNGTGDAKRTIPLEVVPELKHDKAGMVAMARSQHPDSASCQFYITLAPAGFLDMKYAVFGTVIDGLGVVQELRAGDRIVKISMEEAEPAA